ncbi:DNA-directed RNA polymerase subunit K [Candidatus Micrarchaeota archaeon]|nr:DNA-directed RNA polymerase subunit K [Candidatus Micrarchaeota archaeon]
MELTKYEFARIIGARALQLASGAPPLIKMDKGTSFIDVAEKELEKNTIPLAILRKETF